MTIDKMKHLPKIELHRHLDCSVRFSTVVEVAKTLGLQLEVDPLKLRDQFLITQPMKDLSTVLKKFLQTQQILHSEEILSRIVFEAIEDCYNDGINLVEFRYAPTFIMDGHSHLSPEKIVDAFEKGLKLASDIPVGVGFLGILQRIKDKKTNEKIRDFIIDYRGHFVGADLADDENFAEASSFAELFEPIQKNNIPITIHAGETPGTKSPKNVKDAIEILGAARIGHGLQIINNSEILDFVVKKQIPLELCLTSNWLTQSVMSFEAHPIQKLRSSGVPVTVSTDDPGIFDLTLSGEYQLLNKYFGWIEKDFAEINSNAYKASFLPETTKKKYWGAI